MSGFDDQRVEKAMDSVMGKLGFGRKVMSTDFYPLPESEWTDEERAQRVRTVARVNPDDPRRLDIIVQFMPAIRFYFSADFEL